MKFIPEKLAEWTVSEKYIGESSKSSDKGKGIDPDFGAAAIVKTLYQSTKKGASTGDPYDWVDYPPKQLSKKIATAHDRVAIKVYKVVDYDKPAVSGRRPLRFHEIEVQNPVLIDALKDVVKSEGVFLERGSPATFKAPFKPLFFGYEHIRELAHQAPRGGTLKELLDLLIGVLDDVFSGLFQKLSNLKKNGLICFKHAWAYFPNGCDVYSNENHYEQVSAVLHTESKFEEGLGTLSIMCREMAFDGAQFSWRHFNFEIPSFSGNIPIATLPVSPLSFHADPDSVRRRLIARGRKAIDYTSPQYREYSGLALLANAMEGTRTMRHVTGRVVVDRYGFDKFSGGLNDLKAPTKKAKAEALEACRNGEIQTQKLESEEEARERREMKRVDQDRLAERRRSMLLAQSNLVYMSPTVVGFALEAKTWLKFFVDDLKPIKWNDEAYDHLVYPEEQKDLILTLTENSQRKKSSDSEFEDVIAGKGCGQVFLFEGPPGCGKTLTAEAIADKTRCPLYKLQAEELGISAESLGRNLKRVFDMVTSWGAVCLLDEADVFMAKRAPKDLQRNELVSVFLRELEYFRGGAPLVLTTNLMHTIDTAFRSRVSLHMVFQPLAPEARALLWRKLLARLPGASGVSGDGVVRAAARLTGEDYEELARWELNGREITNTIKTVKLWCDCKGLEVSFEKLESGIHATAPHARKE